jgi:hypothetical protein
VEPANVLLYRYGALYHGATNDRFLNLFIYKLN